MPLRWWGRKGGDVHRDQCREETGITGAREGVGTGGAEGAEGPGTLEPTGLASRATWRFTEPKMRWVNKFFITQ